MTTEMTTHRCRHIARHAYAIVLGVAFASTQGRAQLAPSPSGGTAPPSEPLVPTGTLPASSAAPTANVDCPNRATPKTIPSGVAGEARTAYENGMAAWTSGDYAQASHQFGAAYELSAEARFIWNRSLCEQRMGHFSRARLLLDQYQKAAHATAEAGDRREVLDLLECSSGSIGELSVGSDQEKAEVTVDGEMAGTTPLPGPLSVDIGKHTVRVSKTGYVPHSIPIDVAPRSSLKLRVQLEPDSHEGRLWVVAEPEATIYVDNRVVGIERWAGTVASGTHLVRVQAAGKGTYEKSVEIRDKEVRDLRVTLDAAPLASSRINWPWLMVGVALAAGGVVTGCVLWKTTREAPGAAPVPGTMPPGVIPAASWR